MSRLGSQSQPATLSSKVMPLCKFESIRSCSTTWRAYALGFSLQNAKTVTVQFLLVSPTRYSVFMIMQLYMGSMSQEEKSDRAAAGSSLTAANMSSIYSQCNMLHKVSVWLDSALKVLRYFASCSV